MFQIFMVFALHRDVCTHVSGKTMVEDVEVDRINNIAKCHGCWDV